MDAGQLEERLRKARAEAPPDMQPAPQEQLETSPSAKKPLSR
jgi:hypothetical protein